MHISSRVSKVVSYLFVMLVPLLVAFYCLRGYQIDYETLPGIGGDGTLLATLFKSIDQFGLKGAFFNSMIGAPDESALIDTPFLDMILVFEVRICTSLGLSCSATLYWLYYLSFAFVGGTMLFLLDEFGIKRPLSCAISVAYALSSYHFSRGIGHFTLSNYAAVPIGMYLAWRIYSSGEKIAKIRIIDVAMAMFVGLSNGYYTFFSLMLMALFLFIRCVRSLSLKPLGKSAIPFYTTIVAFMAGLSPKIIYGFFAGTNEIAGQRIPMEAELYGLKIIELLMPSSYSFLEKYTSFSSRYASSGVSISENIMSPIGIIATIGFVALCGWVLVFFARKGNIGICSEKDSDALTFLALGTLVLVLYCTVGGFGTIFNYIVSPQFRCYNRASIVICCLCLCAIAVILNWIHNKLITLFFSGVVMLIVVFDQIYVLPSGWQAPYKAQQDMYCSFFESVESSLDESDMVYELPYMPFPESPSVNGMLDYTPFLGYLLTDNVKWSYGGMRGRNETAQNLMIDNGASMDFVDGISSYGFSGILIDTYGYTADESEAMLGFYDDYSRCELRAVSEDGRFSFYVIQQE